MDKLAGLLGRRVSIPTGLTSENGAWSILTMTMDVGAGRSLGSQ
jgi:hypothetical protein